MLDMDPIADDVIWLGESPEYGWGLSVLEDEEVVAATLGTWTRFPCTRETTAVLFFLRPVEKACSLSAALQRLPLGLRLSWRARL